ncbi:MAG: hypothetical protein JNK56_29730 [Myxococcales bacterium]|nr:hypothetical protein [Myxococcales bacterium]
MAFSPTNQPAQKGQNLPARQDGDAKPKRRSRLLGGVNARAASEAIMVAAVLAIAAFWKGDEASAYLDMYIDDGRLWPVDGLLAGAGAGLLMVSKRVKLKHKIQLVPALAVYAFNAIWSARENAGAVTP